MVGMIVTGGFSLSFDLPLIDWFTRPWQGNYKKCKSEYDYQIQFANANPGQVEYRIDGVRVDWLGKIGFRLYACEVDFAKKYHEAIGQALHYSILCQARAGIILIMERDADEKHLAKLRYIIRKKKLKISIFPIYKQSDYRGSNTSKHGINWNMIYFIAALLASTFIIKVFV